jgi:hypothetical protein
VTDQDIHNVLEKISAVYPWTHIEKLHIFDGKAAFTKAHGED